ncbi:hypothetical protein CEXT_748821 [Caerostris extrusa]|uniref:Uncharacterized protein n=1 Tax=Caerostris extrusa TaxID=172846 RepID=A0AAV4QPE7_CAEEX|nr:hypothetical protein CEXT_748821 [Caerostris extrusa]
MCTGERMRRFSHQTELTASCTRGLFNIRVRITNIFAAFSSCDKFRGAALLLPRDNKFRLPRQLCDEIRSAANLSGMRSSFVEGF